MSTMTCREFDEVVHGFVRMELLDVNIRELAIEHAARCSECADRKAEATSLAEATDAVARSTSREQAPPRVEAALLPAFRSHHRRASWRRTFEWATVGAVAAMLIVFAWTVGGGDKDRTPPVPRKDVSSQSRAPLNASAPAMPQPGEDAGATTEEVANSFNSEPYAVSDFVPVPFTEGIAPEDSGMVVRVQLTRASLAELGYPVAETPSDDSIQADVLVGEDGWPRGVKLVQ